MMPRYLTPSKVCLLVLIDLYASDEIPHAARLNVLDLIATQIDPPSDLDRVRLEERFEQVASVVPALSGPLSQWSSGIPGRTLYDAFLLRLWQINNLDALFVFFEHLEGLTGAAPTESSPPAPGSRISRSSPVGQLIRRSCIEFTRLQFADVQTLWDTFRTFREPSYVAWAQRNPDAARQPSPDQASESFVVQDAETFHSSAEDVEVLLGFSIFQLQKLGTRVPQEVKTRLGQWIGDQSESRAQSLQHFIAFFEHWRSGQYTMALESLHRYFDYSLNATPGSDNVKAYYQYALLHLSVLHADFERWEESVAAMDECIATARENHDTACLNYALSWLLYLRQAHPKTAAMPFEKLSGLLGHGNDEMDELAFLKAKAREGKHWSLLSSTLLDEAKLEMYSGSGMSRALEHILQASYLNIQHDLRTLMPAAKLFEAASYDRLGLPQLSDRTFDIIKLIHSNHCPVSDRVRAGCHLAYRKAQYGHYRSALEILASLDADVVGVLKLQQRLQAFVSLVQCQHYLRRGKLDAARSCFDVLHPVRAYGDPEVVFEIDVLEVHLLIKEERFERALQQISKHITAVKESGQDIAQLLHLLVLKGKVFAAGGQPIKAFSIILRAASTCERHLVIPIFASAIEILGDILNALSEFDAARDIIVATLPHALQTGDTLTIGTLFLRLADAHVGIAGHRCSAGSAERVANMNTADRYLGRSLGEFIRIDDMAGQLDCLVRKTRLARWRGDEASAALAEGRYQHVLADYERSD